MSIDLSIGQITLLVEEMCYDLKRVSESHIRSFESAMVAQIARLPQHVRSMSLTDFINNYNGDIRKAVKSPETRMEQAIDSWVEATPKLRRRAALTDTTNRVSPTPQVVTTIKKSSNRKQRMETVTFETPRRVTRSQSIAGNENIGACLLPPDIPELVTKKPVKGNARPNAALQKVQRQVAAKLKKAAMLCV